MTRLLLLLLGCTVMIGAEELRTVAPGVTLVLPTDWTQAKASDNASVVLRSPVPANADAASRRAQASVAISIADRQGAQDGQTLLDESLETLKRLSSDFQVTVPVQTVVLGGRTWRTASYRFSMGELIWDQTIWAVADGQGAVSIVCSTDAEHAAQWKPTFERVLSGLNHRASRVGP